MLEPLGQALWEAQRANRMPDEQAYLELSDTTRALAVGLREAAGDRPVSVTATTGLVTVFFAAEAPVDYAGAAACDTEAYGAWCRALLARGGKVTVTARGGDATGGTHRVQRVYRLRR